ncbi:MAG TPA: iron-containing alcohol dehydrogenase [Acidimicrobiia bacterium]|jgi:alcohol dehydrogenase|nr:iron-containing alcohol dehydrogenase [Acidimicrobiia bacterium]HIL46786.1 iron-containing alcohol dehydrogenase [Acidimicrobiia bacterium]
MTELNATWGFPTQIRIGAGRISELPQACVAAGMTRPLIVTDPGIAQLPLLGVVQAALAADGITAGVFTDVRANPVGANVDAGVAAYKSGDHNGVVALGGGSALDVGKLVALMAGQTRPLWDFEDIDDWWTRADAELIAPVVAVPTTAGTGSEVGRAGVVINETQGRKVIVFHPALLPKAVICDPELTVGLPRMLTVGTGLDALSHSLEAISAPTFHPMAHGIGLEGSRLVLEHLPRVAANPEDLDSRTAMLAAAAMGAVAFQKGLGAMHALAHPIGATFDTHHGMTNAVVMPYVLEVNRPAIEEKIASLAAYAGITGGFDGFMEHLLALRSALDVPHTLVDLGVDANAVDAISAAAAVDPSAGTNPLPCTPEFAAQVFTAACNGTLAVG